MPQVRTFPMRKRVLVLPALALSACASAMALSGVVPVYDVRVSAFASSAGPPTATYVIVPANAGVTPDDLQFREFYPIVSRALASQGFRPATAQEPPQIAVFLAYGVGGPRIDYSTGSVYVPGTTATVTSSTMVPGAPSINSTGSVETSGSFQAVTEARTVFPRFAVLSAIDANVLLKEKKIVTLWKTEIRSEGSSSDIRTVLPYMLVAARPYFGRSSGKEVRKLISSLDGEAKSLVAP